MSNKQQTPEGWNLINTTILYICVCVYIYICLYVYINLSVQFSRSVMSDSLRPHGLQHTSPPCPLPTPKAYSNSCPSHQWCHPTILSSVIPFSSCLQIFSSIKVFSSESVLHITWSKYWTFSFNVSPSSEYSELISFRMD